MADLVPKERRKRGREGRKVEELGSPKKEDSIFYREAKYS